MKEKLTRAVVSLAVVVLAVLAVRWTIRSAILRAYRAERAVGATEFPVVPAPRTYVLAVIVPKDLHVNIAGLVVRRRAERMHAPYSLAVDLADDKAKSAGWERLDDENALTIKNLSGMERVYKTPEGSIVLREVRAIMGDDSLMEDFLIPAEMIPMPNEQTTPDVLARRSAIHVKDMMPDVIRDVVMGSPLMTELIERNGGSAFIVHCVGEMQAKATAKAIESAARKARWKELTFGANAGGKHGAKRQSASCWTKENSTMYFEVVPRAYGVGCDINYRFTDDEAYISKKGKT